MNKLQKINENSNWSSISTTAAYDLISFEELTNYDIEEFSIKDGKEVKENKNNSLKSQSNKKSSKKRNKPSDKLSRKRALLDEEDNLSNKKAKTKSKPPKKKSVNNSSTKTLTENNKPNIDNNKENSGSLEELDMSAWIKLNVPDEVIKALRELKFTKPTPIQEQILPVAIRSKRDILGAAETGSGKTLAFGIPLLYHMLEDDARGILRKISYEPDANPAEEELNENVIDDDDLPEELQDVIDDRLDEVLPALILTPTRELAIQVKDHLVKAGKYTGFRFVVVVGGMATQKQERLLKLKPDVVIATPGRLWELISQGQEYLQNLHLIRYLIIDEADRMLEQGHFKDLSKILEIINSKRTRKVKRQMYMFSATLTTIHDAPGRLKGKTNKFSDSDNQIKLSKLIKKIGMNRDPHLVDLTTKFGTAGGLFEAKIACTNEEKDIYLYYFLKLHPGRTLVFTNSIDCIFHINGILSALQMPVLTLHAKMQQRQRLKNIDRFHNDPNAVLIASDVAARGLDIPDIQHVVHYQVPRTAETYIHRSGRSARTGKEALSLLMIGHSEFSYFKRVTKTLNKPDIADFPFETKYLNVIRKLLAVAKEVDFLSHKERKTRAHNDWFTKNAKEMDIELDDDLLIQNDMADEEDNKLKQKRHQLKALLKTPLFPKNFTGKYLTLYDGSLEVPLLMKNKGDALEEFKKYCKK